MFFLLGASLAQDRGRLEARIEVLGTELETQKKQSERDNDALKIKTKIIDDQTETIRKLKEVAGYFIEISKSKTRKKTSYENMSTLMFVHFYHWYVPLVYLSIQLTLFLS